MKSDATEIEAVTQNETGCACDSMTIVDWPAMRAGNGHRPGCPLYAPREESLDVVAANFAGRACVRRVRRCLYLARVRRDGVRNLVAVGSTSGAARAGLQVYVATRLRVLRDLSDRLSPILRAQRDVIFAVANGAGVAATLESRPDAANVLLRPAREAIANGRRRAALRHVHELIDWLIRGGHLAACGAVLATIDPATDDAGIVTSALTATLPVQRRLQARADLLRSAEVAGARRMTSTEESGLGATPPVVHPVVGMARRGHHRRRGLGRLRQKASR